MAESNIQISVVVPLFNEEESLKELHDWIAKVMKANNFSYELLLIDDGSTDNSWGVIRNLAAQNEHVKGIRFVRNYGKTAALQTGFQACRGEVVITMDADLQDSPDEIPALYQMIHSGEYDLVSGWKKKRYDPITKTVPTKLYNAVTRTISGIRLHDFNCGLKAYRQKVVKSIVIYGEMHRYIPVIAKWNGYGRIGEKVVEHRPRKYGHTKFGLERFLFGFLDLLSIAFVNKFGRRPMHLFGGIGTLVFLLGSILTVWVIGEKLYNLHYGLKYRNATDNPLFFLALLAISVGTQMFLAGFLGELLVKHSISKINEYAIAETTSD